MGNEERPLVSIVTVSFQAEKTIERTIRSVLDQDYGHLQYSIIDGGSTDGTVEIARSFEKDFKEKSIRYSIISEPDNGIYDAMNKGIGRSAGRFIGIINADDWYEADAVSTVINEYRKDPFDCCFSDIRMHMKGGRTFIKKARVRKFTTSRDWNHPTMFVSSEIYKKFRYRCKNISDDMDLYFKIKKAGYRIRAINHVTANFQMGGVSNRIPLREVVPRIRRRYEVYRSNGYSRAYIFECAAFEIIKYLLAR
ncbi:MAG: glycosyltransferase [Lachnospiraceae bacterium]|nr:glycosyltransferase [Lachnospiraceae bacterium]